MRRFRAARRVVGARRPRSIGRVVRAASSNADAAAAAAAAAAIAADRVSFSTDWEGNINYALRYASEHSHGLTVESTDGFVPVFGLRPGFRFVYGGDVCDHEPGDLRCAAALVLLKERYPSRVTLLLGNRDLNKMRLKSELMPEALRRPAHLVEGAWWSPQRLELVDYLQQLSRCAGAGTADEGDNEVARLKWILGWTMGSPRAFENRRVELALQQMSHEAGGRKAPVGNLVDDLAVLASFREELASADGWMWRYLLHAVPAAVIGDTLFVHGALPLGAAPEGGALGSVPGSDERIG